MGSPRPGRESTESMAAKLSGRWCEAAASQLETEELELHIYKRPSSTRRGFSSKGPYFLASVFRGAFLLVSFLALNLGLGLMLRRGPPWRRPPAKSSTTLAICSWRSAQAGEARRSPWAHLWPARRGPEHRAIDCVQPRGRACPGRCGDVGHTRCSRPSFGPTRRTPPPCRRGT